MTNSPMLRLALLGDAAASGATGLLLAAGGGWLGPWLGLPEPLLRWAGAILIPYALVVALIARAPSRAAVLGVIAVNWLWVIDSLAVLVGFGLAPSGLGVAFTLAQAVVVGGFAVLQTLALRPRAALA